MRPVIPLLIYLAVVLVGGALLAPWLFSLTQWGTAQGAWLDLGSHPFYRYVERALLLLALAGMYPFARALGVRRASDVGIVPSLKSRQNLTRGLMLGFGSLAVLGFAELALGVRRIDVDHSAGKLISKFLEVVTSAGVVAILEEVLFRGMIYGALRRAHRWSVALLLSSGVFAVVHFFRKPPNPPTIDWTSGLTTLGQMLGGLTQWDLLLPGFLTMLLVGAILAVACDRTGDLYFSIGLHGGWIFWLRSYGVFTEDLPGTNLAFWGTHKLIDGWAVLFLLVPVFLIVWLLPPRSVVAEKLRSLPDAKPEMLA